MFAKLYGFAGKSPITKSGRKMGMMIGQKTASLGGAKRSLIAILLVVLSRWTLGRLLAIKSESVYEHQEPWRASGGIRGI